LLPTHVPIHATGVDGNILFGLLCTHDTIEVLLQDRETIGESAKDMDNDPDDSIFEEATEVGSDELLSDDHLRLPESASMLVRLHAIRAWLTRRMRDTEYEIGNAALHLQEIMHEEPQGGPLRRREREHLQAQVLQTQQALLEAQQSLDAYEEAQALLEESVAHTTTGERVLVEYYLTLEELLQDTLPDSPINADASPRHKVLLDVLSRVEHVSTSVEDE
jgi:hypothetical protein